MKKSEARSAYRSAWQQFLLTPPGSIRNQLNGVMAHLRDQCTDGIDTEWDEFTKTLPGYKTYWESEDLEEEEAIVPIKSEEDKK